MVGFGIVMGLLFILMTAVLELNKNTLWGFVLLLAATVGFVLLYTKALQGSRWYVKLLGYLGYLAVFALILFFTWPPTRAVPAPTTGWSATWEPRWASGRTGAVICWTGSTAWPVAGSRSWWSGVTGT